MKAFVVFAALTLCACSEKAPTPTAAGGVAVTDGNGGATVFLLKLPDGTRCAALIGVNKGALTCDWTR